MLGIHNYPLYVAACLMLHLTPGQDTFYIVGRTLAQGRRAGIASTVGIGAGVLVHTLFAALGLSALLAASASAFLVVKLLGAAYLIYLGARMLLGPTKTIADPSGVKGEQRFGAIVRQGLLTNVLNPKVALFFLAFMPQFIHHDSAAPALAFVLLGLSFVATGGLYSLMLVWFAGRLSARLRASPRLNDAINRAAGAVFVILGLRLATSRS